MTLVRIKFNTPLAKIPQRGSSGSAGWDLHSAEDMIIPAGGRKLVDTGLSMAFEGPYYVRIAPRSGLAVKNCVDVGAGVIDSDYRGPVKVRLINNHPNLNFEVKVGDRIAQMIIEQISPATFIKIDDGAELDITQRGEGGFGSTGVSNPVEKVTTSPALPKEYVSLRDRFVDILKSYTTDTDALKDLVTDAVLARMGHIQRNRTITRPAGVLDGNWWFIQCALASLAANPHDRADSPGSSPAHNSDSILVRDCSTNSFTDSAV